MTILIYKSSQPMRKCLIVGLRHQCNQLSRGSALDLIAFNMSSTKKKYEDPLRIKFVAKSLQLPEVVVANATSFFLTVILCFVTFFVGAVIRSAFGERGVEGTQDSYLQPLWKYLTRGSDLLSPVVNSAVFPGAISLVFYYFSCLPGMLLDLIDNQKLNSLFKIQPDKKPVAGSYKNTLLYTLRNNVLFIMPGVLFQVFMHGPWLYLQPRCLYYCSGYDLYPQYAPSLKQFLSGLFASLVIFDAMYHYWHRLHHLSRPLYSHIHRIHHEYFSPFVSRSYHILCRLPAQAQVTLNSTNQVAINMHPKPNVGLGYSIRAST